MRTSCETPRKAGWLTMHSPPSSCCPRLTSYPLNTGVMRNTSEELRQFLLNFASFCLLFPGHFKHGPFYLVKGLINALQKYEPWMGPNEDKCRVYLGLLQLFAAYAQAEFLYHVPRVESNDRLYGGNTDYQGQLAVFVQSLLGGAVSQINEIGAPGDLVSRRKQSQLALELVQVLLGGMEMNAASATLIVRLVQLTQNNRATDPNFLRNVVDSIKARRGDWYRNIYDKLQTGSVAAASPSS